MRDGFGATSAPPPARCECLLVECTVCHVAGLLEWPEGPLPLPQRLPAGHWPQMACVFTDGCAGHVWPEWPN